MGVLSWIGESWMLLAGADVVSRKPARDSETVDEKLPVTGGSGTINYDGYLVDTEYLPELRGKQALEVWEEMRRSDPSVRETLGHIYSPIKNADWVVVPPEDPDELEQEITEFIRCALFDWLEQPFEELLDQALSYLYLGVSVFETTFKVEERSLTIQTVSESQGEKLAAEPPTGKADPLAAEPPTGKADPLAGVPPTGKADPLAGVPPVPDIPEPEQQRLPERQFVTWRTFAQRLVKTIEKWHQNEREELTKVTQLIPKALADGKQDYVEVPIEAQYLLVFTYDKQGSEWTGVSALRSAYKPWVLKQLIERTMGIAYERFGVGIPTVFIPSDVAARPGFVDATETMLTNLRAGEQNYLIFTEAEAAGTRPGITFRIEGPGASSFPDYVASLEYLRGEIAGALLTRFKELGQANVGSRATANTQAQVWYNLLHEIARYIESTFQVAIRRLVDMNYTGVTRYPELRASGIEDRNLVEFAQAMALLTNAELLIADADTRAWIRRMTDAPAENKDEAKARLEAMQREKQLTEYETIRGLEVDEPADTKRPRVENAKAAHEEIVYTAGSAEMLDLLRRIDSRPAPSAPQQQLSFEVVNGEMRESQLAENAAAFKAVADELAALRAEVNRPRRTRTRVLRDPDTGKVVGSEQEEIE